MTVNEALTCHGRNRRSYCYRSPSATGSAHIGIFFTAFVGLNLLAVRLSPSGVRRCAIFRKLGLRES